MYSSKTNVWRGELCSHCSEGGFRHPFLPGSEGGGQEMSKSGESGGLLHQGLPPIYQVRSNSEEQSQFFFWRKIGCRPFSLGYDENIPVCSAGELTSIPEMEGTPGGDCRVPCTGIFADVKKHPLQEKFAQNYWELLEEYERYRNFNETGIKFINYLGCK